APATTTPSTLSLHDALPISAEHCSGSSASCPEDGKDPATTPCTDDGNPCTRDECDGTNNACEHPAGNAGAVCRPAAGPCDVDERSEEHTSELQSRGHLVCRL